MHPHMNRHSHAGHSKVKRSTESKINQAEFSSKYWINQAKELIKNKVNLKRGTKKAKNVILFLGDGLSHPSVGKLLEYFFVYHWNLRLRILML